MKYFSPFEGKHKPKHNSQTKTNPLRIFWIQRKEFQKHKQLVDRCVKADDRSVESMEHICTCIFPLRIKKKLSYLLLTLKQRESQNYVL